MKLLDLFSGVGGFSLATRWLNWETIAFVEKDEFCQKVLKKNFTGVPIYDDITILTVDDIVNACYNSLSVTERKELNMAAHRKDYDEAVRVYNAGVSIGDVADFYDVSRQAMWAILKRRGCKFRQQLKYGDENHFHRGGAKGDKRAQHILEKAVKKGVLIPKTVCENCGDTQIFKDGRNGIQAHHCDYNKPLEVLWLCQKCHHKWHKENQAIPFREVQIEEVNRLCLVDIITGGFP